MMIEAIDLSSANPVDPDFARVKSAGIEAVYLRASDGAGWADPVFARRGKAALAAGLDVGAYHFLRARHLRPQDAVEQVREFHALAIAAGVTLAPALDVEDEPHGEPYTPAELLAGVLAALGELEACFCVRPLLYTYHAFVASRSELRGSAELGAYPLWIADYGGLPAPRVPPPWSADGWAAWQYAAGAASSRGRVDGVIGDVDRSRFKSLTRLAESFPDSI